MMPKKGWRKVNGVLVPPPAEAQAEVEVSRVTERVTEPAQPLSEIERVVRMALKAKVVTGDADEAILCAMKGGELGIPLLQSLEGIYLREGKFCMKADLMRATIFKSGAGELVPLEMTEEQVIVEAVRYGVKGRDDRKLTFRFDRNRAVKEGRHANEFFQKYPAATMFAWLTGEAARAFFSDVLKGASYTPEEFSGQAKAQDTPTKAPTSPVEPAAKAKATHPKAPPAPAAPAPTTVVTETVVAPPPLTHEFTVTRNGALVVVRTAGLTLPQMQEISTLCSAVGGMQGHEQRMILLKALMAEFGISEAKYLTLENAAAILERLRPNGKPVGKTGRTRAQVLDELCAANNVSEHRASLERLILAKLAVPTLDEAKERDLQLAMDEVKQLMRDPAAFGLILERAMGEMP